MTFTSGNKGSATLLTILMAAVIITVGLGFSWLVKEHMKAAEGLRNKAEAILRARSAYDTMIYFLLNGQVYPGGIGATVSDEISGLKWLPLNGQKVLLSDDLYVQAQDSNGMLSLTSLDPSGMDRLRVMVRLLRPAIFHHSPTPFLECP